MYFVLNLNADDNYVNKYVNLLFHNSLFSPESTCLIYAVFFSNLLLFYFIEFYIIPVCWKSESLLNKKKAAIDLW